MILIQKLVNKKNVVMKQIYMKMRNIRCNESIKKYLHMTQNFDNKA